MKLNWSEAELECEGFCRLLMKDQSSALPNKEGETKRFGALPVPMPIDLSNLKLALAGQGLLIKVVPEGTNLTPPPDSTDAFTVDENNKDKNDDDARPPQQMQQPGAWE